MPRPPTEEIMKRRGQRANFDERQVRKNIALPEQLAHILERGSDRFDCNESEFIRRLLFVYAWDSRSDGPITKEIQRFFVAPGQPDINELALEFSGPDARPPSESALMREMLARAAARPPHDGRQFVARFLMEHVEDYIAECEEVAAQVDAISLKRETEGAADVALSA